MQGSLDDKGRARGAYICWAGGGGGGCEVPVKKTYARDAPVAANAVMAATTAGAATLVVEDILSKYYCTHFALICKAAMEREKKNSSFEYLQELQLLNLLQLFNEGKKTHCNQANAESDSFLT